jgi:hypothetical protein
MINDLKEESNKQMIKVMNQNTLLRNPETRMRNSATKMTFKKEYLEILEVKNTINQIKISVKILPID